MMVWHPAALRASITSRVTTSTRLRTVKPTLSPRRMISSQMPSTRLRLAVKVGIVDVEIANPVLLEIPLDFFHKIEGGPGAVSLEVLAAECAAERTSPRADHGGEVFPVRQDIFVEFVFDQVVGR